MQCWQLRLSRRIFLAIVAACCASMGGPAYSGGGPENVLLVVNARSWASLAVANHYIKLRQIPTTNVVFLDWDQPLQEVGVSVFRERILQPILGAIAQRRLGDHIDQIVYSSDFPWAVNAQQELAKWSLPPHHSPVGSLTGMTALWPYVNVGRPDFVSFEANRYVRPIEKREGVPPTHGFRGWYGWGRDGALLEAGGEHYLLSMALAVTSGRGNSVPEVIRYLERSASADGTHPKGTIYFTKTDDVRSTTRQPQFAATSEELRQLGLFAEVVPAALPRARTDILGLMAGLSDFNWGDANSTIQPGAICEHLTSFGGMMHQGAGQTPLSEFLRYGAAAASGSVVEPYAIQAKFPLAQMHVHYARGCSAIEAYYQAVAAPWQLLIVGDPLCQPWATFPAVEVSGLTPGATVKGPLNLTAKAAVAGDRRVDRLEWYLDGQLLGLLAADEPVSFDTAGLLDGHHELRVVAIENSPIEMRGRQIVPFTVNNRGRTIDVGASPADTVRWGQPLTIAVRAPGAAACVVFQGTRPLGRIKGSTGSVTINPRVLGSGPVSLHVVAIDDKDLKNNGLSTPLSLIVEPNEPMPGLTLANEGSLRPGFELSIEDGKSLVLQKIAGDRWLQDAGVKPGQKFSVAGYFHVASAEVYQFQLRHLGECEVLIDDVPLYRGTNTTLAMQYLPVALGTGRHKLHIRGVAVDEMRLDVNVGQRGNNPLSGELFDHVAPQEPSAKPTDGKPDKAKPVAPKSGTSAIVPAPK